MYLWAVVYEKMVTGCLCSQFSQHSGLFSLLVNNLIYPVQIKELYHILTNMHRLSRAQTQYGNEVILVEYTRADTFATS